jgi:hypothetical protein
VSCPTSFVRTIGVVDLAGGVGMLRPALTGILPRLTVLAALSRHSLVAQRMSAELRLFSQSFFPKPGRPLLGTLLNSRHCCCYRLAECDRLAAFTILAPLDFLQGRALVPQDQV